MDGLLGWAGVGRSCMPRIRWAYSRRGAWARRWGLGAPGADVGPVEAEVLPQRGPAVVGVEQAAALQFGDDKSGKILVGTRDVGGSDHEAIAGACGEPFLHPVGDVPLGCRRSGGWS